jgi:hypothetical protein
MAEIPDNTGYLLLALSVTFGAVFLYIGSLVLRYRNQQKDEAVIEELGE